MCKMNPDSHIWKWLRPTQRVAVVYLLDVDLCAIARAKHLTNESLHGNVTISRSLKSLRIPMPLTLRDYIFQRDGSCKKVTTTLRFWVRPLCCLPVGLKLSENLRHAVSSRNILCGCWGKPTNQMKRNLMCDALVQFTLDWPNIFDFVVNTSCQSSHMTISYKYQDSAPSKHDALWIQQWNNAIPSFAT